MVSLVLRHPHLYGTPLSHTLPTPGGPMMSTEMMPKVKTVKNIIKQQALKCQDQARKNTYGPSHPGPSPIPLNENVMLIAFEKSSPTPSWRLDNSFRGSTHANHSWYSCYLSQPQLVLPSDQKGGDCSKNASQEHAKAPQVSANSLSLGFSSSCPEPNMIRSCFKPCWCKVWLLGCLFYPRKKSPPPLGDNIG